MKMKEICEKTGLTERAVRLYCERGLITPESYTQNDREYLVFGERDERALRCIAILRAADFSLEEIQTMQNEPFLIEKTVREHTAKLMRESAEKHVYFGGDLFRAVPLAAEDLAKAVLIAFSVVIFDLIRKLAYKFFKINNISKRRKEKCQTNTCQRAL